MVLKSIIQCLGLSAAVSSLGLMALTMFFFQGSTLSSVFIDPGFVLLLCFEGIMIYLLTQQYKCFVTAKLIIENQIMHIEAAKIKEGVFENGSSRGGIEVFISCFGILLDTRIIKFNIDGISLKGVEIGRESICLAYGTNKKNETIRLLHGGIDDQELQSLVEKFRYETGIVPVVEESSPGD